MKRLCSCLALLFVLPGCGTTGQYAVDSPYYAYPDGARLILNQTLKIDPGSATVRLQHGQVVARNSVQERDPYCIFQLSTVSDGPQRVQADEFRVTRVQHGFSTIAGAESPASEGLIQVGRGSHSGGRANYYYKTEFFLVSDSQPKVQQMTCQSNQNYTQFKRYLTVDEIRQALGNIFTLSLPN